MKLYKNTYDLNDGGYQPKTITVPTESKYAIGVKFIKDGEPVEIAKEDVTLKNGDVTIEASDVYHNYAVFEMEATSDEKDDKKLKVSLDKETLDIDAKPVVIIKASFDNLIVNQKEDAVCEYHSNDITVDTLSGNDTTVDTLSVNEITPTTYIYNSDTSSVKIGDDTYKLESKTIDDAECLVLVKQTEPESEPDPE